MSHPNAKLNEYGRLLLVSRLEAGWTQAEVAEAQGISRSTVAKWWKRYREEGLEGLKDRSSRARRLPHALPETVVEAVCRLRRELGAGRHRIAYELGMAASTVYGSPSSMTTTSHVPTLVSATDHRPPACKQRWWELQLEEVEFVQAGDGRSVSDRSPLDESLGRPEAGSQSFRHWTTPRVRDSYLRTPGCGFR